VPPCRPASDPPKTEYLLAGRPAGGLDDEHDSTPRIGAYGAKNTKSDRVSLRLRRVRSALTHVKARMGPTLTKGLFSSTVHERMHVHRVVARPQAEVLRPAEMIYGRPQRAIVNKATHVPYTHRRDGN
jgi:hypothetical protein